MTVNHGVLGSSPCSGAFREFSSAGSEHLPYKQRVGGSNPSTPTKLKASNRMLFLFCGSILPTIFTFPPLCPLPLSKGGAFYLCPASAAPFESLFGWAPRRAQGKGRAIRRGSEHSVANPSQPRRCVILFSIASLQLIGL